MASQNADAESQPELQWHPIGQTEELKQSPCQKVFTPSGRRLALFYVNKLDRFYLTSAICPHARGPLDQGDIEEIGGAFKVMCPLHYYSFDLSTGESTTGLKLQTFETEVRGGELYGHSSEPLSLTKP